jgi:ribose 5-phosphate isomerase B
LSTNLEKMKIAIGCDHAGYELKDFVKKQLLGGGHIVEDLGTNGSDSVDYPDFGHAVCNGVESAKADFGILICGTANGMAMTANKHKGIRCGLCWLPEIGALTKQHNNANVIALPARFISNEMGWDIIQAYMKADYEGGRHQRRVDKIAC